LKYEKLNLIHIQTKNNLVILTSKIYTLIALTIFLRNVKKVKGPATKQTHDSNTHHCRLLQRRQSKGTTTGERATTIGAEGPTKRRR